MHNILHPPVGTFAGSIVEPTDVPTEDILPPILPPTEDILPASEHSPVRFTVGIVISAKLSHLACTPMPQAVSVSHWRRTRRSSSASDLTRCSRSRMACPETDWVGKSRRGPGPFDSSAHSVIRRCRLNVRFARKRTSLGVL